ncbi:aldo/keto reductase [Caldimonas taiwanensis]|uniref:aldo/keto reductase n=1 Tax=Caldimonas taiwanensis TaxID=307483 RepID=UPI000783827B|nr:aldo/keto reductase [Caldimonas taiwanensis]
MNAALPRRRLGQSGLQVTPICLGTMTFGEQVDEATSHRILDRALELGLNFLDTAEMYPVPPSAERYGQTECILGRWFASRPGVRERVVLATKVAGPVRGYDWIRQGSADLKAQDIVQACDDSLRRLRTDVIDLYQIHWPVRNVPMFGALYFDPQRDRPVSSIHEQLDALGRLVRQGKVRAVGLSNETPYGVAEFVRVAEQHGLPRVATVQNAYSLVNRSVENGLDEVMYRYGISLLAYSPLAFGLLTGKYDQGGLTGGATGRLAQFESMRRQRWGRPEALAAARRYNALAREHGLTPTQMALAFCYTKWQVTSTIIGVTSVAQLEEDVAAWGTALSPELLEAIDRIRWDMRDPAQ